LPNILTGATRKAHLYNSCFGLCSSNDLLFFSNGQVSTGGTNMMRFITGGYSNNPTMVITGGNPGNVGIGTAAPVDPFSMGDTQGGSAPLVRREFSPPSSDPPDPVAQPPNTLPRVIFSSHHLAYPRPPCPP
jgi:hypothetical protein